MSKIWLRIDAAIAVGGRAPGAVFGVPVTDGVPADLYWRNRIADGDAVVVPDPHAASVPDPAPEPAPAPTAARKAQSKKD
jgi:hypothetical protein